jgi:Na+/melibiose symporter-like transporter
MSVPRPGDHGQTDGGPKPVTDGGVDRPDWVDPAARCGLEVALVLLIAAYLWANVDSQFLQGVIAVFGIVGAVAVLFYYVNQQALAWVRYASAQNRRRQRKRRRERQQRERRRRQQQASGENPED